MRDDRTQILRSIALAIALACVFAAASAPVLAVPADPNRPLASQTCDVAQTRLEQAQDGSPLISADEQAQVLRTARADVIRLCGVDAIEGELLAPAPDKTLTVERDNA